MDDRSALDVLDQRLKTLLPAEYQNSYESVQPISMGSAGLKYGTDGKVAWDQIWGSFCDLAMAGGPPHKGALLEPAPPAAIDAEPERYDEVAEEICRGIALASGLDARPSSRPGWIRVTCYSEDMAGWLVRAIAMENVAVRREGKILELPAGPHFRLHKEIKNVITVIAKTCHYWMGHMPRTQKRAIADLFAKMAEESPLVAPALSTEGGGSNQGEASNEGVGAPAESRIVEAIQRHTGLQPSSRHRYDGWLGLECPSVKTAVWMMRALVASNVLSRREGTVLYVPIDPATDPGGEIVVRAVTRVHGLAAAKGVLAI